MKNVKTLFAALSLAATFAMSSANATPLNVTFDDFTNGSSASVEYSLNGGTYQNSPAGMYDLTITDAGSGVPTWLQNSPITAFCVELDEFISKGVINTFTLQKASDVLDAGAVDSIERLLSSLSSFTFTDAESAAVQASIWELVYDFTLPGDFANGNFRANNVSNSYLSTASNNMTPVKYELYVLQSLDPNGKQDLLVWKEVSAPSAFALFLLAGGLLAFRARKA